MEESDWFVGINAAALPYAPDGMKEAGSTVGALFSPGFAEYQLPNNASRSTTISNVDVVNYLLGNFRTVKEVRQATRCRELKSVRFCKGRLTAVAQVSASKFAQGGRLLPGGYAVARTSALMQDFGHLSRVPNGM